MFGTHDRDYFDVINMVYSKATGERIDADEFMKAIGTVNECLVREPRLTDQVIVHGKNGTVWTRRIVGDGSGDPDKDVQRWEQAGTFGTSPITWEMLCVEHGPLSVYEKITR